MPDAPEALTDPALPPEAMASLERGLRSGPPAAGGPRSLARRLGGLTSALVLGIVAAAGFLGGVQVQKHQGGTAQVAATGSGAGGAGFGGGAAARAAAAAQGATTTTPGRGQGGPSTSAGAGAGGRPGGAGQRGAGAGAGGAGGAAAAAGAAAAGTVKVIDGANIYVTDGQGNVVKVVTTASSRFTRTGTGSIQDVRPGDTVIVQGQKGDDGVVTATGVTDAGTGAG